MHAIDPSATLSVRSPTFAIYVSFCITLRGKSLLWQITRQILVVMLSISTGREVCSFRIYSMQETMLVLLQNMSVIAVDCEWMALSMK